MRRTIYACLSVVLFGACASSQENTAPRRSSHLITVEEIAASSAHNAFDAVQMLRPNWLIVRSAASSTLRGESVEPVVYSDGVRLGGMENLRSISASDIASIEYVSSRDATTRFGTGHAGGAILVKTK